MAHGKGVRIFLANGTVSGIRHAEIINWTGQAIACPRTMVSQLPSWPEATRAGVYVLIGVDEASGRDAAYIGEAENVASRLSTHLSEKDFWNDVIFFTNKDEKLTKAHVKFLEARMVSDANAARRYSVLNGNTPQAPLLPRADLAAMEEFLESARILLGVLGHRILEPLAHKHSRAPDPDTSGLPEPEPSAPETTEDEIFSIRAKSCDAYAVRTDEGIVVLGGSEATPATQESLSNGYRRLRERLQASGVLEEKNGKLIFTDDHLFSSPSQAAAVIVGYSINGRDAWKTENGTSIGDLEQMAAKVSSNKLLESDT